MFTRNVRRLYHPSVGQCCDCHEFKVALPTKSFPSAELVVATSGGYAKTVGNHGEYSPPQS